MIVSKKLDIDFKLVHLTQDDYNMIIKDRLDFGFDSIYFRYAEVCDELAAYKAQLHHTDPIKERQYMNGRKMHFYEALEQLLHAHEQENKNENYKN